MIDSVRLSVTRWYHAKTTLARIMRSSPEDSRITLVDCDQSQCLLLVHYSLIYSSKATISFLSFHTVGRLASYSVLKEVSNLLSYALTMMHSVRGQSGVVML